MHPDPAIKNPDVFELPHSGFISWILFLVCISFVDGYAQQHYFSTVYTTDHGLAHNTISDITQDKNGFLWFGTWDGLCRFDGYSFRNYYHDPEDATSVPNFSIRSVQVDRHNNVWVNSATNLLALYNRAEDNFTTINQEEDPVLKQTGAETLTTEIDGDLWISGPGGVARYNYESGNFSRISIINGSGKDTVLYAISLTRDNKGNIWISTVRQDICTKLLQGQKNQLTILDVYERITFNTISLPNGFRYRPNFYIDAQNHTWWLSNIGCQVYQNTQRTYSAGNAQPIISGTLNKSIWYRCGNKLIVIAGDGTRDEILLQPDEYPSMVFTDRDQSIWYSTLTSTGIGTGLHRCDRTPGYFSHYFTESGGRPSVVYAINMTDNGELLAGIQGNTYVACMLSDGSIRKINELKNADAAESNHIRSLTSDSNGIYIGYMRKRLDYYQFQNRKAYPIFTTTDPAYVTQPYGFRSLYVDGNDIIVGSIGIFHFNLRDKEFRPIWQATPLRKNIFCFKKDTLGNLWAGSSRKLIKLKKDYSVDTVYSTGAVEYNIEDICFGDNGKIWLALLGGGLQRFDPVTGEIEFYTTADGLSNNTTYSILRDNRGKLWISTDNGISRFDPATGKFRIFGYTDGLSIHEFNSDAAFISPDGKFFFGGMGGIVGFYPDSVSDKDISNASNQMLVFEGFTVSGIRRHFPQALYESSSIVLDKGDNNFRLTFALIDFKLADKIYYRYRLLGHSDHWIETDHLNRNISYAGLKPKKYTLQVEASDNKGNWLYSRNLFITIPPFFYQTLWFSFLVFILAAAVVSVFAVLNYRQIRFKEQQKQNYLKLQSIRGQMNPHFIFNSLNSINYFIAKSDRLSANRYIASFSKLIRSFLTNMSNEYICLPDEIESLQDYLRLEFLRFGDRFNYFIRLDNVKEPERWEVFPGMVQPFIENAIWHGVRGLQDRKGNIHIVFTEKDMDCIQCEITDDGIGCVNTSKLNHNNEHKSKGIQLIRDRLHIINHLKKKNFKLAIVDAFPGRSESGTRVIIDIPALFK